MFLYNKKGEINQTNSMGRGIGIFGRDPCYGIYATPACRATWYLKGNEGSKKKIKKGK